MAFQLNIPPRPRPRIKQFNAGATKGENKRDLVSRIDSRGAVIIENFFIQGDGRMIARQGLTEIVSGDYAYSPKELLNCGDDILVYARYDGTDTKLFRYDISTSTSTEIYSYTGEYNIGAVIYGDFLYFCNGREGDKPRVAYKNGVFLNYDNQSTNFTAGRTLVGSTSGATALIVYDMDEGSTGTLSIKIVSGTFQDNESITDGIGGSAKVDGTTYKTMEMANAPKCEYLTILEHNSGSYLLAGNTENSESEMRWSKKDMNVGIPFLDWSFTSSTAPKPEDGYFALYPKGRGLNSLLFHGGRIYSFYENALSIDHLENINVDGVGLIQNTVNDYSEVNYGGAKNSISTKYGVFYGNEKGIFQIIFGGTSPDGVDISNIIVDEMEGLDFTDIDFVWDGDTRLIITMKKESTVNNFAKVYDMDKKAWTTITGWNIQNMCRVGKDLYGTDSSTGALYKLLDGYDDNGTPIEGRILYKQEDLGDPTMIKKTRNFWIQGLLSPSSQVTLGFHTWGKKNILTTNKKILIWAGDDVPEEQIGYGYSQQQLSEGEQEFEELRGENFAHKKLRLNNILKYQLELVSSINTPLEIHFYEFQADLKRKTRVNNLSTQ